MSTYEGKAVIVTGATFGIGKEIAHLLAQRGWPVVGIGLEAPQVSSIADTTIAALQAEADNSGFNIKFIEADVTNASDIKKVVETTLALHGSIFGVVNNAAIGPLGTILDTDPDLWDQIMAVNLKGPYLMSREIIPLMKSEGVGRIINIGSGAGWGKPNMAAYSTSKGGLIAFSSALALDHFKDRIAVNVVIPGGGGIAAGMSLGRVSGDYEKLRKNAVGNVAGRYTSGDDLGKVISFLLSDDGDSISGTVIDVGCFFHQGSSTPL